MGMGAGPDVPMYLRTKSSKVQIRNRRMPKRDVEQIIKQIWTKKAFSNESMQRLGKPQVEMPDFFYQYLLKEYGVPTAIAEVAYNLLDACKRYSYDADVELFLKVMNGTLDDDVYDDQMQMLKNVREGIRKVSEDEKGKAKKGKPSKPDILGVIRSLFPFMSEEGNAALKVWCNRLQLVTPAAVATR